MMWPHLVSNVNKCLKIYSATVLGSVEHNLVGKLMSRECDHNWFETVQVSMEERLLSVIINLNFTCSTTIIAVTREIYETSAIKYTRFELEMPL